MAATTDMERALARLIRGLIHEVANPLNSMLMSCELASASLGDDAAVQECLDTIGASVRGSGDFLRQVGALASGHSFEPTGHALPGTAIDRARGLLGSRATGHGCKLVLPDLADGQPLPINAMAVAVALAYVMDGLMACGATRIEIALSATDGTIALKSDAQPGADNELWPSALRLARQVCGDHGGQFVQHDGDCTFVLAS